MYKEYTTECSVCKCSFTYNRRVQTKGKFSGNWMGRGRQYCSETCAKKRQRDYNSRIKALKMKGDSNNRAGRKTVVYRLCRKLGGVEGSNYTELQLLQKLEELVDFAISDVPHDEITVQQNYIDAVNDMLELGIINSDQQVKMMKIAERW